MDEESFAVEVWNLIQWNVPDNKKQILAESFVEILAEHGLEPVQLIMLSESCPYMEIAIQDYDENPEDDDIDDEFDD